LAISYRYIPVNQNPCGDARCTVRFALLAFVVLSLLGLAAGPSAPPDNGATGNLDDIAAWAVR
jgi:hypothetical protein